MNRELKVHEAILEATDQLLAADPKVYVMGLGVSDPKGVFGTTLDLHKKYGSERVMDMPTSENGMTGVAIGSAIVGMRPMMCHQRADFMLLALDQLVNNGSKWREMFGAKVSVPLVVRLIVGRGWGQGPQHAQSLHSFFAHVPGLSVVAPSNAADAKGLLVAASAADHPVIYLEHRWLHNVFGPVPQPLYATPLGKANRLREGSDITIIASSHMTLEGYRAAEMLAQEGISAEVIDLRTLKPLDDEAIVESVEKTGHALILDGDWKFCGLAAEISALLIEKAFRSLKAPPKRITFPDAHSPTSWALANHFYPTAKDVAIGALEVLGRPTRARRLLEESLAAKMEKPHDIPDPSFTGPF